MNNNPEDQFAKPEQLIAILAVVIAGVVQVTVSPGPYNFWNVMIAVLLGWVLLMYPVNREADIPPLSFTWGFVGILGTGIVLQEFYKFMLWLQAKMPPFKLRLMPFDKNGEAPSVFYFIVWLIYSFLVYKYLSRRLRRLKQEQSPEAVSKTDAQVKTEVTDVTLPLLKDEPVGDAAKVKPEKANMSSPNIKETT